MARWIWVWWRLVVVLPDENNGGTLTLQIDDWRQPVGRKRPGERSENLSVTGAGTLVVTEDLNLSGLNLSVEGGITIELAADNPGITLTLSAEQASMPWRQDGVTIEKAAGWYRCGRHAGSLGWRHW